MVRHRYYAEILYGRYRDFFELSDRIRALEEARGWSRASLWTPRFQQVNAFVVEWEYPDLAAFERETAARFGDAEYMELVRQTAEVVAQGTARDELLQAAGQIA